MKFGDYIKINRLKRKLSIAKAAKLLGISSSYLSSLESGSRHAPSFELQQKIADVLGLSKNERHLLFDLAAESKKTPALADDLNKYIYQNIIIRDMLRYSMECSISDNDWETIFSFIKKNYHY